MGWFERTLRMREFDNDPEWGPNLDGHAITRIIGIEKAARLCQTRPETKVLLVSGYTPDLLTMKPEWDFVQKPFAVLEMREKIRSVLTGNCLAAD